MKTHFFLTPPDKSLPTLSLCLKAGNSGSMSRDSGSVSLKFSTSWTQQSCSNGNCSEPSIYLEGAQFSLGSPKCPEVFSHTHDLAFICPSWSPTALPDLQQDCPLPVTPPLPSSFSLCYAQSGESHGSPKVPAALQWWAPRGWWQPCLVPMVHPRRQMAGPWPLPEDRISVLRPGHWCIIAPLNSQLPIPGQTSFLRLPFQQSSSSWGYCGP